MKDKDKNSKVADKSFAGKSVSDKVDATQESPTDYPHTNELQSLTDNFEKKIPSYLDRINETWGSLNYVQWDPAVAKSLQLFCHRMTGSLATYGFTELSNKVESIATLLQQVLDDRQKLTEDFFDSINQIIKKLEFTPASQENHKSITPAKAQSQMAKTQRPIIIVDDDEDTALYVQELLRQFGYQCHYCLSIKNLMETVKSIEPSVVVMDINFPEGRFAGIKAIKYLRDSLGFRVPVIMHSARGDIKVRIQASHYGCDGFLSKPVNSEELIAAIDKVVDISGFHDRRVLIIDDDRTIAMYYRAVLKKMGIETKHIADPMNSIKAISEYQPHLILLDNMMPGITGVELAKLLKQDPRLMTTGILFISADHDLTLSDKAFSLGADGFLQKPVSQEQLSNAVRDYLIANRRKTAKLEHIVKTSHRTRLSTQNYFYTQAETLLLHDHNNYHALLMITIEGFDRYTRTVGMAKASLLMEDIASHLSDKINLAFNNKTIATRLGDSSFIILVTQKHLHDILAQCDSLIKEVNLFFKSLSGDKADCHIKSSVAPTTEGQDSIESLISRCEKQLQHANKTNVNICDEPLIDNQANKLSSTDLSNIEQLLMQKQYSLVFQPILSINAHQKGQYIVDSFVRLSDQKSKYYSPAQFFPLIKDKTQFTQLDRYVIETVIEQLSTMNKSVQREVFIQAHLSDYALNNRDTLLWISNSLRNKRILNPATLVFELSEKSVLRYSDAAQYFSEKVHLLGCHVAINGFGESNKSYTLLDKIKPNSIKFKADMLSQKSAKDTSQLKVLSDSISKAQEQNIQVIATNVEDACMLSELYSKGIYLFQGYFITRPAETINLESIESFDI
jgi:PleD family two-component response regulator/EAL domain-containing protein (putative c-di-GMP-specific phosphodiesterase class I)